MMPDLTGVDLSSLPSCPSVILLVLTKGLLGDVARFTVVVFAASRGVIGDPVPFPCVTAGRRGRVFAVACCRLADMS